MEDTLNLGEGVDDVISPAPPTQHSLRNGLLLGVEINKFISIVVLKYPERKSNLGNNLFFHQ